MEYKWKKSGLGMKELFRKFVENMKNGKIKKDRLFIAFLTGVLMLVIAIPSETGQKREENSQKNAESFRVDSTKTMSQSDYTAYMEERLETILSQIEGAGKVQVMITWKTNGEKIGRIGKNMYRKKTIKVEIARQVPVILRRQRFMTVAIEIPVNKSHMSAKN